VLYRGMVQPESRERCCILLPSRVAACQRWPSCGRTERNHPSGAVLYDCLPGSLRGHMDHLRLQADESEYHWTLSGTYIGPGGTGHRVRISGFERWRIGSDGLIASSQGHFDAAEYRRQWNKESDR
jgi:hypothetical protein